MKNQPEKNIWDNTAKSLGNNKITFSHHWSYNYFNDPKRLGFVLSRYKFAHKMIPKNSKILELGCSEGIGSTILCENAKAYVGIDLDKSAIDVAINNFSNPTFTFINDDFLGKKYGDFDAVVSLDVVEHIYKEHEKLFFDTINDNLSEKGLCIIGTPNITAAQYASDASKIGHVNLYSQERLEKKMKEYFHQVFCFGINDEIVHTGFASMKHYLIVIGCHKK